MDCVLSSDGGEQAHCLLPELGTGAASPAELAEGTGWAQESSDSCSMGKGSASSLSAASMATGCLIFAN